MKSPLIDARFGAVKTIMELSEIIKSVLIWESDETSMELLNRMIDRGKIDLLLLSQYRPNW